MLDHLGRDEADYFSIVSFSKLLDYGLLCRYRAKRSYCRYGGFVASTLDIELKPVVNPLNVGLQPSAHSCDNHSKFNFLKRQNVPILFA
jgi:hypothetical protein